MYCRAVIMHMQCSRGDMQGELACVNMCIKKKTAPKIMAKLLDVLLEMTSDDLSDTRWSSLDIMRCCYCYCCCRYCCCVGVYNITSSISHFNSNYGSQWCYPFLCPCNKTFGDLESDKLKFQLQYSRLSKSTTKANKAKTRIYKGINENKANTFAYKLAHIYEQISKGQNIVII
jgi:hypothetical protein